MKRNERIRNTLLGLLMCILAAGAGTYAAIRQQPTVKDGTDYSITVRENITEPDDFVNVPVTGIADERTTQVPTTVSFMPYTGSFALPMGTNIIKDYSNGEPVFCKTMNDWRVHSGVDFAGAAGNDVISVAPGKVTAVYTDSFWGTVVEIDHGNGMTVRYCGLQSGTAAKQGAEVDKFEKIGALGHVPAEISEGDHLHLEVLVDGNAADPLKVLNKVGIDE